MQLSIQEEVLEEFHPILGVIVARGVNNDVASQEVDDLLRGAEAETRSAFAAFESHGQHPNLAAWRHAYKKFGSDPHQYRSSAESLVRRVLKGESVPKINPLVDLYNYISLKYIVPVGGEDMNKVEGDVLLAFADGTEEFIRLHGAENEPPSVGEVVYKDSKGVICRRWNWREADRTKLTENTKNAIIVIDGIPPMGVVTVERATRELSGLVMKYCGGIMEMALTK